MRIIQKEACNIIPGFLVRQSPFCLITVIIRLQHHIELTAGAVAVVFTAGHIEPADPLAGLPERSGRAFYEITVHLQHLTEVFLKTWIFLL